MIDRGNELKYLAKEASLYGNYSLEIQYLHELIKLKKSNDDAVYLNLAHAYFNNNQTQDAIFQYNRLSHASNTKIQSIAYQQLGIVYAIKFRQNIENKDQDRAEFQLKKALLSFKKALIANPNNDEARYNYELLKLHPLNFKKPEKNGPPNPNKIKQKQKTKEKNKNKEENTPKEGEKIAGNGGEDTDFKPDENGTEKHPTPSIKQGEGNSKNSTPSKETSSKNEPDIASGKNDPNGSQKGGLEKKQNGSAAENGERGKISLDKKVPKEKPQLNKDKLKKMNLSLQAAEQILNNMKMAEKQYIQQQQKKSNKKHHGKNDSRW